MYFSISVSNKNSHISGIFFLFSTILLDAQLQRRAKTLQWDVDSYTGGRGYCFVIFILKVNDEQPLIFWVVMVKNIFVNCINIFS